MSPYRILDASTEFYFTFYLIVAVIDSTCLCLIPSDGSGTCILIVLIELTWILTILEVLFLMMFGS
jgi:hypothetical protein